MSRKGCAALLAGTVAMVFFGVQLGASGAAPRGSASAKLKVTCEQLYDQIDKTATRLAAEYDAKGSSIDLIGSAQRCYKEGKRTRRGKGYMIDTPPIPGEADPAVSDYYYSWVQTVTRTRKGKLRSAVSDFKCARTVVDDSGNYQPGGSC